MRYAKLRRDESGASAVEFAITAPVFFAVVFGIIEGGLLLWTQLGLQHGAEMAARCAAVNKTMCNNSSAVQNFAVQNSYDLYGDYRSLRHPDQRGLHFQFHHHLLRYPECWADGSVLLPILTRPSE